MPSAYARCRTTLFTIARLLLLMVLAVSVLMAGHVAAQGTQSSEIKGLVTDATGGVVPGATVALTSPALQGERVATTDSQGGYVVRGLPPGTYKATFASQGLQTSERIIELRLASVVELNITLGLGEVKAEVTVVGQAESIVQQPQVSVSLTKDVVDVL